MRNLTRQHGDGSWRRSAVRWMLAIGLIAATLSQAGVAAARGLDADDAWASWEAIVVHSGDGVNVREEPDPSSASLIAIADGTTVTLRLDETVSVTASDGTVWWPVEVYGISGWVSGVYLASADGDSSASSSDVASAAESSDSAGLTTPDFARGDYVAVLTDDGTGLTMRAGPARDEERLAHLGDGDVVQVMDGPYWDGNGDGWYLVTDGSFSAYVFGPYLTGADSFDGPSSASSATFADGDWVGPQSGIAVNVRKSGQVGAARLGTLDPGETAQVVDGPVTDDNGEDWYLVDASVGRGYALGSLLQEADGPATPAAPVAGEATGDFGYPLANFVFTQAFGCSPYGFEPYSATLGCPFHNGIDLAADAWTPLGASDGGVVTYAGWCDCGLGYYVEIDHGNGFATIYGHLVDVPPVAAGQALSKGDLVGYVGSTGNSTGPHVHFIIKVDGTPQDPLAYL